MTDEKVLVGVIMGSTSDWETMRHAHETLDEFGVPHECKGRFGTSHAGMDDGYMRIRPNRAASK